MRLPHGASEVVGQLCDPNVLLVHAEGDPKPGCLAYAACGRVRRVGAHGDSLRVPTNHKSARRLAAGFTYWDQSRYL